MKLRHVAVDPQVRIQKQNSNQDGIFTRAQSMTITKNKLAEVYLRH